jgi:hypothetical protein
VNYTIEYTYPDGHIEYHGLYADKFMAQMNADLANRDSLTDFNGFCWTAKVVEVL